MIIFIYYYISLFMRRIANSAIDSVRAQFAAILFFPLVLCRISNKRNFSVHFCRDRMLEIRSLFLCSFRNLRSCGGSEKSCVFIWKVYTGFARLCEEKLVYLLLIAPRASICGHFTFACDRAFVLETSRTDDDWFLSLLYFRENILLEHTHSHCGVWSRSARKIENMFFCLFVIRWLDRATPPG